MKHRRWFAAALGLAAGMAASAAWGQQAFSLSGTLAYTDAAGSTVACNTIWSGTLGSNGVRQVSAVAFSPGNAACPLLRAKGLPWPITPVSANKARIDGISLGINGLPQASQPTSVVADTGTSPYSVSFQLQDASGAKITAVLH